MNLVDTHAHLYWDSFKEDFAEVLQKAAATTINTIINIGVDPETSKIAAKLESNTDQVKFYSTIGIHPHEFIKYSDSTDVSIHEDIEKLKKIYQENPKKVKAVGECGLDFLFDPQFTSSVSPSTIKQLQHQLFQAQIDLAKKLNLPLIVHCREAWDEVLPLIGDYPTLLHCYSGQPQTTQQVLQMPNTLVSFAATITYPKNDYLKEAARILPLDKIVLETDCPFLPPQSKRGTRNEPANVLEVAKTIAEIKNLSLEEVSTQTTENVKRFLHLGY